MGPRLGAAIVLLMAGMVAVVCWRGLADAGVRGEWLRLAAVLGAMFVAIHLVYHALYYLGQLLVDRGKIRQRAMPTGSTLAGFALPLLQSWPVAIVLLLHCAVVGLVIDVAMGWRGI